MLVTKPLLVKVASDKATIGKNVAGGNVTIGKSMKSRYAYSVSYHIFAMDLFEKIFNNQKPWTVLLKSSLLDFWQSFECFSRAGETILVMCDFVFTWAFCCPLRKLIMHCCYKTCHYVCSEPLDSRCSH